MMQDDFQLTLNHIRWRMRSCNEGAEVVSVTPDKAVERISHRDLADRVDRVAHALARPRHRAGRQGGDLRLEQPASLRAVHGDPVHRRGAPHAQRAAVRRAARVHHQPRRGPRDLRRRSARAVDGRARPGARVRRALRRDRRRRRRGPARGAALRGAAGRGGPRAVPVPRARRAPGSRPLLHERDHGQPEGGPLLPPLDQPPLDGHADARRNRVWRAKTGCWRWCRCSTPTPGGSRMGRRWRGRT